MSEPLKIAYRPVASLIPAAANPRRHSAAQIGQIAAAIGEFGWTNPILIDEGDEIIAGHGRLEAAKRLAMDEVPVIVVAGLSDAQKRILVIADNKIADNAGWDEDLLQAELEALLAEDVDVSLTGYSEKEIAELLGEGTITVEEIPTTMVRDRFWISIRGPLAQQADTLARMKEALAGLHEVEVELGTTSGED